MIRASAIRSCVTVRSATGLPKVTRASVRLHISLERTLGRPDRPHAVMDAARSEPPLRDLESAPFAKQDVRDRDPDILKQRLGVAVRRIVLAEDRERPRHLHPGRLARNEHHGLLVVARPVRCGLAHEDQEPTAGSIAPVDHHFRPLTT